MRNPQEYTEAALARIPVVESLVGTFVSQSGPVATVDCTGRRVSAKSTTTVPVLPGDAVRLERRGSSLVMTGPTNPRAVKGRVTVAGNPATVEYPSGSGVTETIPVANGLTVSVDDIVFIDWGSGGLVVTIIDSPVTPAEPEEPPAPAAKRYDQTFFAVDSGAYQSGFGWRTNDVWSSASNIGAWFYGSSIRDTIPDSAVIIEAYIYLPLVTDPYNAAPPFGRHGADTKPGGSLSFSDTSVLGGKSGWVGIPLGLIDHLKANPGGLGFGLASYTIWRGTQGDGQSGAVRVVYEA